MLKCPKNKFSTILCKTKRTKVSGHLVDPDDPDNTACAVGVMAIACGWKPKISIREPFENLQYNSLDNSNSAYDIVNECLRKQGAKVSVGDIYIKNDNGWSFKRIAEWLRKKGL